MNGSLSIWAAHQNGNVICSDILPINSDVKKKISKIKNGKIRFEKINALSIPYEDHFDFIVFKSILGGIGRDNNFKAIENVMAQIHLSLKKGGECLFIENMYGTYFHHNLRMIYGAGKNKWYYPTLNEFNNLSSVFSKAQYQTFGFFGSTGKPLLNIRQNIDKGIDQFIPPSWKYIYAGHYIK